MVEQAQPKENTSASIEEDPDHAEHAVDDVELLAFQKQRSMPKVRLSNVGQDGEEHLLEVDDFANIENKGEEHYGMMKSGGEEKIVKQLIKAGSLDPDGMPLGSNSPGVGNKSPLLPPVEEEKKE